MPGHARKKKKEGKSYLAHVRDFDETVVYLCPLIRF